MSKPPSPPPAKRRSLLDVVDLPSLEPSPAETRPQAVPRKSAIKTAKAGAAPQGRAKYPSATVYLPRGALRLIKEIGLEENRRMSDIIADAVDEYLSRRGHPSLGQLSD
jgi:hypothetical protein